MIDETVLERLLHDEADTYVPPPGGPENIEALAADAEHHRPRRTPWLVAAAAAAVVGIAVAAPVVRDSLPTNPLSTATDTASRTQLNSGGGEAVADTTSGADSGTGGFAEQAKPQPGAQAPGGKTQADAAHVVRTGEITVEVPEGRVATVLRDATRLAGRLGGYVSESAGETATDAPNGFVTIRVPVASFDTAVDEAGKLGEVTRSTTRGQDVSDQVSDTAARLRSLRATRGQLETLLSRARTVGEVLSVQQQLTEVQTQIEQLQARQASLTDRTTYGTLKVSVETEGTSEPAPRSGFAKAWDDAVDAFVGGFEGLVRVSGTLAFLLLICAAVFFVARTTYRAWVRKVV